MQLRFTKFFAKLCFTNLRTTGLGHFLFFLRVSIYRGPGHLKMNMEDEIREFRKIIGTFRPDSDAEEEIIIEHENEMYEDEFEDTFEEQVEVKPDAPNSSILFLTGLFGLIFFISVFIGTIVYFYLNQVKEVKSLKSTKPSQSLKIPGIERIFMDPRGEASEPKIKVWVVATAIPPEPLIYDYSVIFDDPANYFEKDELEKFFNIKVPKKKKQKAN